MELRKPAFEQGPIRPPNEANSLLLRVTRNCPWNRCLFCPVYKTKKFSRRSPEEIKNDINAMHESLEKVRDISRAQGSGGRVTRQVAAMVHAEYPELFSMAFWQYHGGKNVFLQDGDSLLLPVEQLTDVLYYLKGKFPGIDRITTYARSKSLLRRSVEELAALKKAGLNRIHVGLESGNDSVLDYMKKGVTGAEHVEAGLRVKEAGIALSEYVLLGLGGKDLWREHALDTAAVLNKIDPDFIRVRTLAVRPKTPLGEKVDSGEFRLQNDDEVVREEKLLIKNLEGLGSQVFSDHILNLLEEINGKLPGDKDLMLEVIDSYLDAPERKRELFRLGRRSGYLRSLADLDNSNLLFVVEDIYRQVESSGMSVDDYIAQLMRRFV